MKRPLHLLFLVVAGLFFRAQLHAQPFIDPLNFNTQLFHPTYKDSVHAENFTRDYTLNVFLPKEFANGNVFLLRLGAEKLHSEYKGDTRISSDLYAFSLPVGFQFLSANRKWKSLLMAMPKISSDLWDNLSKDIQYGGLGLITYVKSDSLKLKLGLFYNREFFGNFFVPLVGIDWKSRGRISVYGLLPNNLRIEYKWSDRFFTGIGFKSFQRSYRLGMDHNNDFVRVKENQAKLFADYFIFGKVLLFGDVSYTLGYKLIQYKYADVKTMSMNNPVYMPMKDNVLFTVGVAYRIRKD